jgi:hypothetical protein
MRAVPFFCGLTIAVYAQAEPAAQRTAHEHFEQGYQLVQAGNLDGAIAEFERAYQLRPHFSVLYNLGQAYATLGRSVEAVDTLERYLSQAGSAISEARRGQVRETIAFHSTRIGVVHLSVAPAGARVSIDGTPIAPEAWTQPIRLNVGVHGLVVEHPMFAVKSMSIRVEATKELRVAVQLEPLAPARVELTCPVPDVTLRIDGERFAVLASARLVLLPPGSHQFAFHRSGYLTDQRELRTAPGEPLSVTCSLKIDPSETQGALLAIRHPPGTHVLVDGVPYTRRRFPAGRHHLSLYGAGYEREERMVTLPSRGTYAVQLHPSPAASTLLRQRAEREKVRRTVGYIAAGTGVAAVLAAGAIFLYNNDVQGDWRAENERLVTRWHDDPASVKPRELDDLLNKENGIRNRDAAAIGLCVFGVMSLAVATASFLWSDAPSEPSYSSTAKRPQIQF